MTKTYEHYYNAPEIVNEPMPLREVHAARLMIYDEIKDMTIDERVARTRKATDPTIQKYGLKVVISAN